MSNRVRPFSYDTWTTVLKLAKSPPEVLQNTTHSKNDSAQPQSLDFILSNTSFCHSYRPLNSC